MDNRKMYFNPEPNKQAIGVLFSHKINLPKHSLQYFNNQEVYSAAHHKHLGLILDSKLTFAKRISQKISIARNGKSSNTCRLMPQLKPYTKLDYGDIIYYLARPTTPFDYPINFMMQSLESTQYQAALAVSGTWKG